jgi:hypothetical protein
MYSLFDSQYLGNQMTFAIRSYLFIYNLFNEAASNSDCIESNVRVKLNNELGFMWMEALLEELSFAWND